MEHLIKRISPEFIRRSLRAKLTLGIIVPLVLILGAATLLDYTRDRSNLLTDLSVVASYNGRLIKDALWHSMLESNFGDVQRTLDSVGTDPNFRVVYILDATGRVIFTPNGKDRGIRLDNRNASCQTCHRLPAPERPRSVVVDAGNGQRVFRSMQPIENRPACSKCHDPRQKLIGLMLTDIYVQPFEASLTANLRETVIWWIGAILATVLIANLMMRLLVINRLRTVVAALAAFAGGRRALRLSSGSSDEVGRLESGFNQMAQQIQDEEAHNQILSEDLRTEARRQQELVKRLITVQEDERKRVARELHDELGQSLGGLALRSEATEQLILSDPKRALEELHQTREMIGKTTQQMYELILALRPSVLDDLGLVPALRSLAGGLDGTGVAFHLDSSSFHGRLPSSIETSLYRIFQEALSNVVRHSGASEVSITLVENEGIFEGEIVDNGRGFDPDTVSLEHDTGRGLGLLGMQERVLLCGGSVNIASGPGEGTRIRIRIPLRQVKDG